MYRKKKTPKSPGEIVEVLFAPPHKRKRYRTSKIQQDVMRDAFADDIFYKLFDTLNELKYFLPSKSREKLEGWVLDIKDSSSMLNTLHGMIKEIKTIEDDILIKKEKIEKQYRQILDPLEYQQRAKQYSFGYRISKLLGMNNDDFLHREAEIEKLRDLISKSLNEIKDIYIVQGRNFSAYQIYNMSQELKYNYKQTQKKYTKLRLEIYCRLLLATANKGKYDKKQLEKEARNEIASKRSHVPYAVELALQETQRLGSPCPYCGTPLTQDRHREHIHPVSQGGKNNIENMVFICSTCNSRKNDLTLNMYIDKYKLNSHDIFSRLKALRKRY